MRSVLVLGGETRMGLAVTRSLGKAGSRVFVAGNKKISRSFYSKYCSKRRMYNSANKDVLYRNVIDIVKELRPDVIFPATFETTELVVERKKELSRLARIIPIPDFKLFNAVNDKALLTKLAHRYGVDVPITFFPKEMGDIKKIRDELPYPVLIKPRIACGSNGCTVINGPEELTKGYNLGDAKSSWYRYGEPIIQKFRPSNTTSAYYLMHEGTVYGFMMIENLLHHPYPFGPPIRNITIHNMDLKKKLDSFLKAIRWEGLACISFIRDPDDSKLKIIDFNPRVWGQMDASICFGVDFPKIAFNLALGNVVQPTVKYKNGQIFSHIWFGELANALKSQNKLKNLAELTRLRSVKNIMAEDPIPNMVQCLDLIKDGLIL
jgi:predicted ATP-grasp superfamily ATP-dependent carboligase